jgi:WD40 repeat protein
MSRMCFVSTGFTCACAVPFSRRIPAQTSFTCACLVGDSRIPKGNEALAFSPDGKLLATDNAGGEVVFWNTTSGEKTLALKGRAHALWGGAFTPNGSTFVTVSSEGPACLWDVATGKLVESVELDLPKYRHALLSQDARLVAVMPGESGPISVWDTKTGKQLRLRQPSFTNT